MNEILYGHNDEKGIVAVQLFQDDQKEQISTVRVYVRKEGELNYYDDVLYPTLWISDMSFLNSFPSSLYKFKELEGDNFYKYLVVFDSWFTMWKAVRKIKERAYDLGITDNVSEYPANVYLFKTPEEQYLMQTGKTMFKGLDFDDVHRFYFDLETYSSRKDAFPNADREGDYIYIVTAADNRGFKATYYVDDGNREVKIDHDKVRNGIRCFSEAEMLNMFIKDLKNINPDTIENHNIFSFDLPYLHKRLNLHGIKFNVGRDGSEPEIYESSKRFAERVIDFPHYKIAGRHIIDTMFETMNYDTFARDLPGYGLKVVSEYFGFAPEGRTYIDGDKLSQTWDDNPHAVLDYADDDVVEVSRLSRHLGGSTFYLTQMLPMPYQRAALAGTSTKIESLLVRRYLHAKYSMPTMESGKQEVGGYTDLFLTGVYNNVIYADVASLYPSIMLNYDVAPEGDDLGAFKNLLQLLTDLRLQTKADMNAAKDKVKEIEKRISRFDLNQTVGEITSATEELSKAKEYRQMLDARQSSYKLLINSFYGQLGFTGSIFNDFSEADRVTVIGQQLLRQMIRLIVEDGGEVVEVDTDGILTMAPPFVYTLDDDEDMERAENWIQETTAEYAAETGLDREDPNYDEIDLAERMNIAIIDDESYVKELTKRMPNGIIIDFDGRAKRMMSYKKKNYALREPNKDKDKIKGGSMVSRMYEPFGRKYISEIVSSLLSRDILSIAETHRKYVSMISKGDWTPDDFRKRSRLKDSIDTYIKKTKKGSGSGGRNKDAGYELAIKRWEDTGIKPEPGDTIHYYIAGDKKGVLKVFEEATFVESWTKGSENKHWYLKRLKEFAKKFEKFFTKQDHSLIFSDVPIETINFDDIEIQNKKVKREYVTVVFVGPETFGDDFWVERAIAGAKFLKTLDKDDYGYSINHIVTTKRSEGMDEAINSWANTNNVNITRVDEEDKNTYGKMTNRKTALKLIEKAKAVNPDHIVAAIVIQDEGSNNELAYEVIQLAKSDSDVYKNRPRGSVEFKDFPYHISTTV